MSEDTDAKSDKTSEEEGKNTDDSAKGKDTPPKLEDAEKKFTQADLDRVAAKTREEEKTKAKAAKDKEEKERLAAQAEEQGEFKKLADDRQAELDDLKPKLESATAEIAQYKSTVADIVKAELKALPEEVRDMSPGKYDDDKTLTNPLDVLAWLPKGKKLADALNSVSGVKVPKPAPRANGDKPNPDADRLARAAARQAYRD